MTVKMQMISKKKYPFFELSIIYAKFNEKDI